MKNMKKTEKQWKTNHKKTNKNIIRPKKCKKNWINDFFYYFTKLRKLHNFSDPNNPLWVCSFELLVLIFICSLLWVSVLFLRGEGGGFVETFVGLVIAWNMSLNVTLTNSKAFNNPHSTEGSFIYFVITLGKGAGESLRYFHFWRRLKQKSLNLQGGSVFAVVMYGRSLIRVIYYCWLHKEFPWSKIFFLLQCNRYV